MVNEKRPGDPDYGWWEALIEKITSFPWGILVFLVLLVLMFSKVLKAEELSNAKALLPVAGLLGIGHGIHQGAKHFRR